MPDSHRTFPVLPEFTGTLIETETLAAEWVRASDGRLVNVARADAIVMRKATDDVHEIHAVFFGHASEPLLFRGTFQHAGDVMANLGDALGAYVPTTADDQDPEDSTS